jgi:hypothetical protein
MQMLWCHQLFQGHGCSSGCSCNPVSYVLSFGCPRPAPATCHGQHLQSSAVQVFCMCMLYAVVFLQLVWECCNMHVLVPTPAAPALAPGARG